jgi:hypothetical protein
MSRKGGRVRGSAVVFRSHGHKTRHQTTTTRRTTVTRTTK